MVEMYLCFGGTTFSVLLLEDSIILRNVKVKIIYYNYRSELDCNTTVAAVVGIITGLVTSLAAQ
jgi:hypothetical protein